MKQILMAERFGLGLPSKIGKDLVSGRRSGTDRTTFCEWLDTIRPEHAPQAQWAERLGVQPSTLSKWKAERDFSREAVRRVKENYHQRLPGVIEAISKCAESGDIAAARLLLEFVIGGNPKQDLETCLQRNLTIEEAAAEAAKYNVVGEWLEGTPIVLDDEPEKRK